MCEILFPKALIKKFQKLQKLYHNLEKVKEYYEANSSINENTKR